MKNDEREPVEKKVYAKPAIRRVQLHPEESMSGACKSGASTSAFDSAPCIASTCFADGS